MPKQLGDFFKILLPSQNIYNLIQKFFHEYFKLKASKLKPSKYIPWKNFRQHSECYSIKKFTPLCCIILSALIWAVENAVEYESLIVQHVSSAE